MLLNRGSTVTSETRSVFCASVVGQIPVYPLYEDTSEMASVVPDPIRPSHVLVLPTAHAPDFYSLDDDL